eukprot:5921637-Pleurochrysis_carterae.AAC.1
MTHPRVVSRPSISSVELKLHDQHRLARIVAPPRLPRSLGALRSPGRSGCSQALLPFSAGRRAEQRDALLRGGPHAARGSQRSTGDWPSASRARTAPRAAGTCTRARARVRSHAHARTHTHARTHRLKAKQRGAAHA